MVKKNSVPVKAKTKAKKSKWKKPTPMGQIVLDTICENIVRDKENDYGPSHFWENGYRGVPRKLVKKGIPMESHGGIISGLIEAGFLDLEAEEPKDMRVTPAGWTAWSGWKAKMLTDSIRDDWDGYCSARDDSRPY